MVSPPIQVFLTTIVSQPALRQRQEYILRILQAKNITFNSYDLASDEDAKRLWRRKAPLDKQQLPGILVGGKCPGSFANFEEAVEYDELATFLRLNDSWDESIEEQRPTLPTKPIGVPGASSPSQMASPAHRALFRASPGSSPLRGGGAASSSSSSSAAVENKEALRRRGASEFDVGDDLSGYGLQGVKVTEDDLLALVQELGLGGEEADDLVKGLGDFTDRAGPPDKGGEAAGVLKDDGGGTEQPEEPGTESVAEAKPEEAVPPPVVREEAKADDDAGKAETEVADVAST
ncbi:hypothetical protein F5148DRAFT_1158283 [Russula earlei]|uniref:Uncharacterized protein n=1 Tax=Russula earlei TaxID=71964 RepID=A0ACC0UMX7_9AGAM|nr:hypothetical protein F5148DRAFT_1158283 [Russula earlei]